VGKITAYNPMTTFSAADLLLAVDVSDTSMAATGTDKNLRLDQLPALTAVNVRAYGATGDGTTNDTTALQAALTAAGSAKLPVCIPPAPGGCYRTNGITVPSGVPGIYGSSMLSRTNEPTSGSLTGSVLAPYSGSAATLLTIGSSGSGSYVSANPHGLTVDGIGFLGTTAAGAAVANMWGIAVTDTSDVTLIRCRDLWCDAPSFTSYPTGGNGTGGFARFLSSASGNGYAENGRLLFCHSYGAGRFLQADGIASGNGGSTDGSVLRCQSNGHNYACQFGPANAGAGGWDITECHFSSTPGTNHISYGTAGTPWTLRVNGCYFDVITTHIACNGRGLIATGNYFLAGTSTTAPVQFGSGLTTNGRDPAAVFTGNTFDLNGKTSVTAFVQFGGMTAANVAAHAGGVYASNLVHNHGAAMPGSWVAQFTGSDSLAVSNTSGSTLTLTQGPVLSA
jgi:Pectate lyase superfamily protein